MKTKNYCFVFLLTVFSVISSPVAYAQLPEMLMELHKGGAGEGGGILRSTFSTQNPFDLYLTQNVSIKVVFKKNIGQVKIEIVNQTGTILYNDVIDTAFDTTSRIDISHMPAGKYKINIISEIDSSLSRYGNFDITD